MKNKGQLLVNVTLVGNIVIKQRSAREFFILRINHVLLKFEARKDKKD